MSEIDDLLWELAILPTILSSYQEMDGNFKVQCAAEIRDLNDLKKRIIHEYKYLRGLMKEDYYEDRIGFLDNKKLSAIVCKSLIRHKPILFNTDEATKNVVSQKQVFGLNISGISDIERAKKVVEYNAWTVNNVFVNYKIAYRASLQLLYIATKYWLSHETDNVDMDLVGHEKPNLYQMLKDSGGFVAYPRWDKFDSFDVNIIVALAHGDIAGRDLDLSLYSLQLWQMEMYTILALKHNITTM